MILYPCNMYGIIMLSADLSPRMRIIRIIRILILKVDVRGRGESRVTLVCRVDGFNLPNANNWKRNLSATAGVLCRVVRTGREIERSQKRFQVGRRSDNGPPSSWRGFVTVIDAWGRLAS